MNRNDRMTTGEDAAMPQEIASAVNLLAHPLAGFAAAGAIGFGLASQAAGLWLGTLAGVAESSSRMLGSVRGKEVVASREPLRLVVSKPAERRKPVKAEVAAPAKVADDGRPSGIARPQLPDDLKAISGVGPKLEKVLNGFGLWTYRQIAGLSAAEIDWLDRELGFAGRIGRDDWVGQARALSKGA